MTKRALSSPQVDALKARGTHWVSASLYLQIKEQGSRSWVFRYERQGKVTWLGLGAAKDVTLTEARGKATRLSAQLLEGVIPAGVREAAKAVAKPVSASPTFKACAMDYIAAHEAGWRNDKHRAQWSSTLETYVYPTIGSLPVSDVTVEHVLKILKPLWTKMPETASRVRGRIEMVLGMAEARGWRSGPNPALWKGGALVHMLPPLDKVRKVKPRASVPYKELPGLVSTLRGMDATGAKAMLFAIYTAARPGEVTGAVWSEIDLDEKLWVVPAERMKADREHRVPLSDAAVSLLRGLDRQGRYVFPGLRRGGLSANTMVKLLQETRGTKETAHGFRSSFSTWAREQTDYPREIVESCLAHVSGDAVELAYRRTTFFDKRRDLMQAWATFCATGKES